MAEEQEDKSSKTEEPTGKKLNEAKNKGQVARSVEVITWATLVAICIFILFLLPWTCREVMAMCVGFIADAATYPLDFEHVRYLFKLVVSEMALIMGPAIALFFLASFTATVAQVGWSFSTEKLQFKLSVFSPIKGAKRIFGVRALVEFAKGLVKLGIVSAVFVGVSLPLIGDVEVMPLFSLGATLQRMQHIALVLTSVTIAIMTIVAALDYAYQRWDHYQNLRMTKREVRDEQKQSEGDPQVKKRIAQVRLERSRARMIASVAKADVVITNPTHYAVALQYDMDTMPAPRLLAKGVDDIAKRIREAADEHEVPIVENAPLARAIYASVELDQEIPPQYYHAVAEVISYVFRLVGRLPRKPGERLVPPKPDWSLDPDRASANP